MTVQWWYILMKKNTAETEDRETQWERKPINMESGIMVKQHLA